MTRVKNSQNNHVLLSMNTIPDIALRDTSR